MKKSIPNRPNTDAGGKPMPVKMRFLKQGVMIFQPTMAERAKIAMGFNIKVSVNMALQHNPGVVQVESRMDVTKQNDFTDAPMLAHMPVEPIVTQLPRCPKCGSEDQAKAHVHATGLTPEANFTRCNDCGHEWGHA